MLFFNNGGNRVKHLRCTHRLINYIDTKAKCHHAAGVYQSLHTGDAMSKSCWYFRPSFVNCCPSNLLSGSNLPSPASLCEIAYYYCMGRGGVGVWGSGPQTDNTCRKSLYRSIFLDDDILLWSLYS
jgi:hypothetical protein